MPFLFYFILSRGSSNSLGCKSVFHDACWDWNGMKGLATQAGQMLVACEKGSSLGNILASRLRLPSSSPVLRFSAVVPLPARSFVPGQVKHWTCIRLASFPDRQSSYQWDLQSHWSCTVAVSGCGTLHSASLVGTLQSANHWALQHLVISRSSGIAKLCSQCFGGACKAHFSLTAFYKKTWDQCRIYV